MRCHTCLARFIGSTVLRLGGGCRLGHWLGSGCGLAGIVAARFAEHVSLTDYLPNVRPAPVTQRSPQPGHRQHCIQHPAQQPRRRCRARVGRGGRCDVPAQGLCGHVQTRHSAQHGSGLPGLGPHRRAAAATQQPGASVMPVLRHMLRSAVGWCWARPLPCRTGSAAPSAMPRRTWDVVLHARRPATKDTRSRPWARRGSSATASTPTRVRLARQAGAASHRLQSHSRCSQYGD